MEGTSVANLMQAAGLTHGGFYRHFDSKEALVAEESEAAFIGMFRSIEAPFEKLGPTEGLKSYVSRYLSGQHVKRRGAGCPVAALGGEVAREDDAVRRVFAERIGKQIDLLSKGLEGSAGERRAEATRLLATLVGAVVIARAVGDDRLAADVLKACRQDFDAEAAHER